MRWKQLDRKTVVLCENLVGKPMWSCYTAITVDIIGSAIYYLTASAAAGDLAHKKGSNGEVVYSDSFASTTMKDTTNAKSMPFI